MPQSPADALLWLQKAAEQGHVESEYLLGTLYEHGQGALRDINQATFWFDKAAKRGNAAAKASLARLQVEERINRLNIAAKSSKIGTQVASELCLVADPKPPLNVRTTPDGSIVGTLDNGTKVLVLEHSADKLWVFLGRSEDLSPIGWVDPEHLSCNPKRNSTPPSKK